MENDLGPAKAFGALLRDNKEAARFYDSCTPEQRQAILQQLHSVQDMRSFVEDLPHAAL